MKSRKVSEDFVAGASSTAATLKLVCGEEGRSQGDIATAAMASINQFLTKQVTLVMFITLTIGGGLKSATMYVCLTSLKKLCGKCRF